MLKVQGRIFSRRSFSFHSYRCNSNLLGHLISYNREGNLSFGVIDKIKLFPTSRNQLSPKERKENELETELNQMIEKMKEIEVSLFLEESRIQYFPPSSIEYFFFQSSPPSSISKDDIQSILTFCKEFQQKLDEKRTSFVDYYTSKLSKDQHSVSFTADELLSTIEKEGNSKIVDSLPPVSVYNHSTIIQFAVYWWIQYGNGKDYFQVLLPTDFSMGKKKAIKRYPIVYTLKLE